MMHSKSSAAAKKKSAKVEPAPAAGGIDTPVERSKPDTSTQQATASVLDAKPSTENLPETPYKEEAAVSRKLFPESATDAKPDDEGPINHAGDKENEETEFTTVRKSELLRVVQIVEKLEQDNNDLEEKVCQLQCLEALYHEEHAAFLKQKQCFADQQSSLEHLQEKVIMAMAQVEHWKRDAENAWKQAATSKAEASAALCQIDSLREQVAQLSDRENYLTLKMGALADKNKEQAVALETMSLDVKFNMKDKTEVAVIERNAKDRESRLISRLDKAQEDNKALEQMVGLLRDRIEALQTESQHLASQCVIERQRRDMAEERAQQMETETEESIANVKELWQYEAKNAATAFTEVARIRGQANTWRARMFGVLWLTASVIVGVMWITTDRVDVFDVENDEFFA